MRLRPISIAALLALGLAACGGEPFYRVPEDDRLYGCRREPANISLAPYFCATVYAEALGVARQIVVTPEGVVYVMRSATSILALRDTNGDGIADVSETVGPPAAASSSGLALSGSSLYADYGDRILRFSLTPGQLQPSGQPETIVSELPTGGHAAHALAVDPSGNLFVTIGSASNVCETSAPTNDPCPELETRAGVWRFDANTVGQVFSPAARYATGIRDAVGVTIHPESRGLWLLQLGRDSLENPSELVESTYDGNTPADELLEVSQGRDFGWPYCYYELFYGRVLAPEYGGDQIERGRCGGTAWPSLVFSGRAEGRPHGIVFYNGRQFPRSFWGGAFIAFNGTFYRPDVANPFDIWFFPRSGQGLTYQGAVPFAWGFSGSGRISDPRRSPHSPSGIALGPDGTLYVSDDRGGRIYQISYDQLGMDSGGRGLRTR